MEVIILGSGTCVPSARRAGPGALLRADGQQFLIDSASGTLRQLARIGVSPPELDFLLYTHLHVDHTGDFAPLVFSLKYGGWHVGKIPRIFAAEGFQTFREGLEQAWGEWVRMPGMELVEFPVALPSAVQEPPFIIRTAPVNHSDMSLAWRIEDSHGRSVVFSGDTDMSDSLVELAGGADLLVLECAFPEGHKVQGHLTPSEAGLLAERAGVGQLVLTHFYPVCDEHDMLSPCRENFSRGPVMAAEDFLRIAV
jgi:ribonuclease BN (tRNA processing enzyme)